MIVIAYAAAAVMTLAVALVLIAVVVSVRGEDRHGELPHQAPSLVARSVRRLTGLRVCQPGEARLSESPFMQKASHKVDRTHTGASPAQAIDQPHRAQTGRVSDSPADVVTSNRRQA
jgi:hypothetical protein